MISCSRNSWFFLKMRTGVFFSTITPLCSCWSVFTQSRRHKDTLMKHALLHVCLHFFSTMTVDVTAPDIYWSMFYEIYASYDNFDHIYTDGSKMGDRVAPAAICSNMVRSTRLPNNASIFWAELHTPHVFGSDVCNWDSTVTHATTKCAHSVPLTKHPP